MSGRTNDQEVMRRARANYDKRNPRTTCLEAIRKPEPEATQVKADIAVLKLRYGDKTNGVIAAIRNEVKRINEEN